MNVFHGKLLRKGKVIVGSLDGKVSIGRGPRGEEVWTGFFSLPARVRLGLTDLLELILDDDRANQIRIERINTFGPTLTVSFLSWPDPKNEQPLSRN